MRKKSAIGIIGGMGPEASRYLYELLIDLSIKEFGAKHNDDFPEIVLFSVPVPDFISNNKNRDKALQMLKRRVIQGNAMDISYMCIACNTAHVLLPQLQPLSKAPFISMIGEVVREVKKDGKKLIGLIGTPSTIKYGLYQSALKEEGIDTIVPNKKQIEVLEKIIRNVLKGKILEEDRKSLRGIADSLRKRGAQAIVLGCTELPIVFPQRYNLPVYNSVKILAAALLRRYYR